MRIYSSVGSKNWVAAFVKDKSQESKKDADNSTCIVEVKKVANYRTIVYVKKVADYSTIV